MAHIEAKLAFFQVVVKQMFMNATKARQAHFAQPSEVFDSVDVVGALGELILEVVASCKKK